ncbi:uncharacterized protein O3C94_016820 isoform 2-T2 [Discoglossus pictus]
MSLIKETGFMIAQYMAPQGHTMTERILTHTLEIIFLLTGEVSLLKHVTDSQITLDMKTDKKTIANIMKHTLRIIDLLTGEEYTVVKKSSPHSSIHQLTGEVPLKRDDVAVYFSMEEWEYIEGHKELYMDVVKENDRTNKTLEMPPSNSVVHDENPETVTIIETQVDEKGVPDIEQLEIQSYPSAGDADIVQRVVQIEHIDEQSMRSQLDDQEQDIQENTSIAHGFPNWNSYGSDHNPHSSKYRGTGDVSVTKSYQEANGNPLCNTSMRIKTEEVDAIEPDMFMQCENTKSEYTVTCFNNRIKESAYVTEYIKNDNKYNYSKYGGNTFPNTSQLLLTQSSEEPVECSECGKCCRNKSQLIVHQKIHTIEKPFTCCVCGKCFRWKSHLVQHQRMHTGEKPFACPDCENCYSQKSHLVRHQKFSHGIQY